MKCAFATMAFFLSCLLDLFPILPISLPSYTPGSCLLDLAAASGGISDFLSCLISLYCRESKEALRCALLESALSTVGGFEESKDGLKVRLGLRWEGRGGGGDIRSQVPHIAPPCLPSPP